VRYTGPLGLLLNFVIRLNDDSGINEKFEYLTTGEKYINI